jgi:dihydrofolate synthase/folylpolyglutamate synthase
MNSELHFGDRYNATLSDNQYTLSSADKVLFENVKIPLLGNYQIKNIPGVLMALEVLCKKGFIITKDHIRHGLENVITQTKLKGRWQLLSENPLMICDTGHNAEGIRIVVDQLKNTPHQNLHVVMGVVKDKAIEAILNLWPATAMYYFCEAKIPRALSADTLLEKAKAVGLSGIVVKDVNEAIEAARANAKPNDLIFIGGSTFVVAEIKNL